MVSLCLVSVVSHSSLPLLKLLSCKCTFIDLCDEPSLALSCTNGAWFPLPEKRPHLENSWGFRKSKHASSSDSSSDSGSSDSETSMDRRHSVAEKKVKGKRGVLASVTRNCLCANTFVIDNERFLYLYLLLRTRESCFAFRILVQSHMATLFMKAVFSLLVTLERRRSRRDVFS
jgi:hypothetical protein